MPGPDGHFHSPRSAIKTGLKVLAVVLVALVVARLLLFESFRIAAGSMAPTLRIGDRVLMLKTSYGLREPFSTGELVRWAAPERGDIVVFRIPGDARSYIKRVVAVPGDTIEVRATDVILNGEVVSHKPVEDPAEIARVAGQASFDGVLIAEQLDGKSHYVQYARPEHSAFVRNSARRALASDQFFVLGDNRSESDDSRSFGPVLRSNIEGKVQGRWWTAR